jgi:hypothetical protein
MAPLMSLGYKTDEQATREAFLSGRFQSPDSKLDFNGGEHLKGLDKSRRREQIRDRVGGYCERCGAYCYDTGEWNHKIGGIGKRDNLDNGEWLCQNFTNNPCHRGGPNSVHPGPQMGRIPE